VSYVLKDFVGAAAAADAAAETWAALAGVVAGGGLSAGRVRVSRDGGRTYPASRERPLTARVPGQPAAVRVFGPDGTAQCLSADFDVARGGIVQVSRDVQRLLAMVEAAGGRAFTDRSPSGGRHVYVPLAQPVELGDMRSLALALSGLLPTFDPAPLTNVLAGCIRPPGARHRSGGWQTLDGSVAAARAVAERPNGPAVWQALRDQLAPQMATQRVNRTDPALTMPREAAGAAGTAERAAVAAPAAYPGGPRPLGNDTARIAREGAYPAERYASSSEARYAVLAAAAKRGWTFVDVVRELEAGRWAGLWRFYDRYQATAREALARDWLSVLDYLGRADPPGRDDGHTSRSGISDTREPYHAPPPPDPSRSATPAHDGYGLLRSWWTAVRLAERDRYQGPAGYSSRLVLRALGNAGQKTGRHYLAFGVRSLSLATGTSYQTTSKTLRSLMAEPDPLITRVVEARGLHADLYELRVPDAYAERARTDAWRPGRIEALLPAFRVLGVPAAFVYEVLDATGQSTWDIAASALVGRRTVEAALLELAAHGLAERDATGWRRGPSDPHAVARSVGALEEVEALVTKYRAEREAWRTRLGVDTGPSVAELDEAPPAPPEPQWIDLDQAELDLAETPLEVVQRVLGAVLLEPSAV
jgi:hypothetical protein